jgi:hypothetical protein
VRAEPSLLIDIHVAVLGATQEGKKEARRRKYPEGYQDSN